VTMAPEAVARRLFELVREDDTEGILELLDRDVVWHGTRGGMDANRVTRGPEAFVDYMHEIEQTWEQFDVEVEHVIEPDETVVASLNETAQGRGGLDVHNETAVVFKVRRGRIVEGRGYLDRDEALAAAKLSE
jgi:ketosteroid isomerase-like protein